MNNNELYRKRKTFGETGKTTNFSEYFGTEPSNFNLNFLSSCFPRFLIEVLPNKCFILIGLQILNKICKLKIF